MRPRTVEKNGTIIGIDYTNNKVDWYGLYSEGTWDNKELEITKFKGDIYLIYQELLIIQQVKTKYINED